MKRIFYITLLLLPLLINTACEDKIANLSGGCKFPVLTPGSLYFGSEGGTQRVSVSDDLYYVSLSGVDFKSCVEAFGEYRYVDIEYGRSDQYPVVGDFGVCVVTVTSPTTMEVTVPANSEYRFIELGCGAYDGRADVHMHTVDYPIEIGGPEK